MSDQSTRGPGFHDIADWFRKAIVCGKMPPGSQMPSEAEVVTRWHVSRITARRAFAVLEQEWLVEVVPGRGRWVRAADNPRTDSSLYHQVASAIRAQIAADSYPDGCVPGETALATQYGVSVGTVRMALRLLESSGAVTTRPGLGRFVVKSGKDTATGPADRVATKIRAQIESGELPPGRKIPSEAELVAAHGVSRGTVRRALAELEKQGIVESVQGVGRYVRET